MPARYLGIVSWNKLEKFVWLILINLLKLIIDLCEKENIKLLILEMPGYKKDRHKFIKKVIHLDDKQNVFVVDYNYFEFCELFDDHKDWIGNSHLNQYGAQKFTGRNNW